MLNRGQIIILEDDTDDKEFFEEATRDIGVNNEIVWFTDAPTALNYLKETNIFIFIIFSDINLPGMSGLEFKMSIDSNPELRRKSIPFVFYSTFASREAVITAYTKMTVQGFFSKSNNYEDIKNMLHTIFEYWDCCNHPNLQ